MSQNAFYLATTGTTRRMQEFGIAISTTTEAMLTTT